MKNLLLYLSRLTVIPVLFLAIIYPLNEGLAQATPGKALLALSKANHTLSIVDPVTLEDPGKNSGGRGST